MMLAEEARFEPSRLRQFCFLDNLVDTPGQFLALRGFAMEL